MRGRLHPDLEARTRCADPTARQIVEAHTIVQNTNGTPRADIRQRQDQWALADSTAGLDLMADGGVRLSAAITTFLSSTTGASNATDLDKAFPYSVADIVWGGADDDEIEIQRVKVTVNPKVNGANPKTVAYWQCELFSVTEMDFHTFGGNTVTRYVLAPLAAPNRIQATGEAAGEVTFDYSTYTRRPQPKKHKPTIKEGFLLALLDVQNFMPRTVVFVYALKADGSPADNAAWVYDNGITSFGTGNVLRGITLVDSVTAGLFHFIAPSGKYIASAPAFGVPKITVESGSFVTATIAFTGANKLDVGGAPSTLTLAALAETPPGTAATFQIRNDADSAYVSYIDGQTYADLGLTPTQLRKFQVILTPNAGGTLTPIIRRAGVEEKAVTDLSEVAEIRQCQWYVDPITLQARITQARLVAVKDGEQDFAAAIEDLLAANDIGSIDWRWYWGDRHVTREKWLHLETFPLVDDFEPTAADVGILLLSCQALVTTNLPKYDTAGAGVETPDADLNNTGSWTDEAAGTTNLYTRISENPPDDTNFAQSPGSPASTPVTFRLSDLADPGRDTGHYLDVRFSKSASGGENLDLTLELRQGYVNEGAKGTLIMTGALVNISDQWTDISFALTVAQAQSISDYTQLGIRCIANVNGGLVGSRKARISWMQLRVTGQRVALTYTNQQASAVFADLLSQAELPTRWQGPRILDTELVSKTIRDSDAWKELQALAANYGSAVISSGGRLKAVNMFDQSAPVALWDDVQILSLSPGYRERIPTFSVDWNFDESTSAFLDQANFTNTPALTKLGRGRIDAKRKWDTEASKYIYQLSRAKTIAERTVRSVGTGLIGVRVKPPYRYPEVECGDPVAFRTAQFLGKDPQAARGLRGNLWIRGIVYDVTWTMEGFEYGVWVQSYADIYGNTDTTPTTKLGLAGVSIISARGIVRNNKILIQATGNSGVGSIKVATSTVSYPAAGTGTSTDGSDVLFDAGIFAFWSTIYVTVTPYAGAGATGVQGPVHQFIMQLPAFQFPRPNVHQMLGNPSYEDGLVLWALALNGGSGSVVTDSTKANTGNKYLSLSSASGQFCDAFATDDAGAKQFIEVNPGDVLQFGGAIYRESGTSDAYYVIQTCDKDGTVVGTFSSPAQNTAAWLPVQAQYTVPAGIKYVAFFAEINHTGTATVARFDDVFLLKAFSKSTGHNAIPNLLPTAVLANFYSYASAGVASHMYLSWGWNATDFNRPDQSILSIPAPPAAPAAPTLSQVAGGALAARTRWARIAYVKSRRLYPVSAESSFAISINNLLKVQAPTDPGGGLYDGWAVLVGSASNAEIFQSNTQVFGVDWTEPAGGFNTTGTAWSASWKSITAVELTDNATVQEYGAYNQTLGQMRVFGGGANDLPSVSVSAVAAWKQNGDGMVPMSFGPMVASIPVAGGSNSGNGGGKF